MISKETCERIWSCQREIETAETLLVELGDPKNQEMFSAGEPTLRDAFGRRKNFQLGIPIGENRQRLYDVSPQLAKSVIKAHIENKKAELAEANEQARIELRINEKQ